MPLQKITIFCLNWCLGLADIKDVLWSWCSWHHVVDNTHVGFIVVCHRSTHGAYHFACTTSDWLVGHPLHRPSPGSCEHCTKWPICLSRHFFDGRWLQTCRSNTMAATTAPNQIYQSCMLATLTADPATSTYASDAAATVSRCLCCNADPAISTYTFNAVAVVSCCLGCNLCCQHGCSSKQPWWTSVPCPLLCNMET